MSAGLGSLSDIGDILTKTEFPRDIIIFSGKTSYKIVSKYVDRKLSNNDFNVLDVIIYDHKDDSELDKIYSSISKDKKVGIIAIGGGHLIDSGKYLAYKLGAELAVIPTILSTNAIASPFSVLWIRGLSSAIRTKVPNIIIGDYEILKSEPHNFIAAGYGDLMARYTSLFDWRISYWLGNENYMDYVEKLVKSSIKILIKRADDIKRQNYIGIETMFYTIITDGYLMALADTTRPFAGSEHLIAFGIEKVSGKGLHGEQVALGTIIASYLQNRNWRKIREVLRKVGVPTTASELGLKKEEMIKALLIAKSTREWITILSAGSISEAKAERILKYTGIID